MSRNRKTTFTGKAKGQIMVILESDRFISVNLFLVCVSSAAVDVEANIPTRGLVTLDKTG